MKNLIIIFLFIFTSCSVSEVKKKVEDQIKIWIGGITSYGNYCGPFNEKKQEDPIPSDDLDNCCRNHDIGWPKVREDSEFLECGKGLRSDIDTQLVECVESLDGNPSLWDNPPEISEGKTQEEVNEETLDYINALILLFTPCSSK